MDPERKSTITDVKQAIANNTDLLDNVLVVGGYSLFSVAFLVLFHLLAARYLGPQEYSVLGTFASILFTVILISSSIYLIITRFVTYHHTRYQYEQINYLVRTSLKYFFAIGFFLFLVMFIFASDIAAFFNVETIGPVIMLGFAVWLQMLAPIYEGAFKGLENLHAIGRMRLLEWFSRYVIGLIFAYLAFGLTALIFAMGLGTFIALSFTYNNIKDLQRLHVVRPNMHEIWEYARPVILMISTLAIMLNMDLILVKHFFTAEQAGIYAAASLFAKIPFFIGWTFSSVIFPRVTKLYVDGKPSGHILRISLKWMSVVVILSTLLSIIFANNLFTGVFGAGYGVANYMGLYAFAMGLLAIVYVLSVYQLALKRFTLAKITPWFLAGELFLFTFFHSSIFQIVVVTVLVTALLVATTLYVLRNELQLEYLFNE